MSADSSFQALRTLAATASSGLPPAVGDLMAALGAAESEEAFLSAAADLYDRKSGREQAAVLAFVGGSGDDLAPLRALVDRAVQRSMLNAAARLDGEVKSRLAEFDRSAAEARAKAEELHRRQGQG
jgi:hypothetical protein